MTNIHPTAIIDKDANIGQNVIIGAYSVIGAGVSIGDGTTISTHTLIEGDTIIGKNNQIFSHAVIGSIPQDLKYSGEKVQLIIGDNNKIREHTLINPGTKGGGSITKIGNNNLFMGHTHIGHDCIFEDNIVVANSCAVAGHVEVASNTVIGGMSAIHQFVHIGEGVMIGGGAIVIQDIPPFCLAEGNRAVLRGLNINGLRRKLQNRKDIDDIKLAYKKLFKSSNPLAQSANELLKDYGDNNFITIMAHFVLNTKRGIPYERK
jgi:UDP-N-acetylglucosamine acyltransferase